MANNSDELKPVRCGCGGEAEVKDYSGFGGAFILVACERCGMQTDLYATEAEAIEAWNRAMSGNVQECAENARCTERTAKAVPLNMTTDHSRVYKCTNCGQYMHSTGMGQSC